MSDPLLSTIPRGTLAFLREGRQLEDRPDPGVRKSVRIRDASSLQLQWLPVTSEETEFEAEDPQCYGGVYYVAAISLSDDDALLIWFPEYGVFGQWDAEHWKAYQFPGVSWEQIVADPTRWLNEMYGPAEQRAVLIRPWRNPQAKFKTYEELRSEPEIEKTPLTEEMFAASACVQVQNAIFGAVDEAAAALAEIANVESRNSVLPRLKLLADEVTAHRAQLERMEAAGLSELDNRLLTENAFRCRSDSLDRIRDNWLRIKESGLATEQLKAIVAAFSPYAVR